MKSSEITRYLTKAPSSPGVYFWRDEHGKPLYIGKAASLKSRLSSYRKATDPRIELMIDTSVTLDWQELDTDIEALITESQLIKRWRPKFNVALRDDKQYFFVAVTDEQFPQFILTHQAASSKIKKPIKELIGPFTEGLPLKSTLRMLRTLFPYCTCKQKHHLHCLNAHIGKCPGYCCLRQPSSKSQIAQYKKNVRAIRDILTGKRDALVRRLARQNPDIALRLLRVFQNAQINARRQTLSPRHHGALEQMTSEFGLHRTPNRIEGYDIANIQGQHATGSMVVFTDGRADNTEYRLFNIKDIEGDVPMLRHILERRLTHPEWQYPDLILVDGGKAQLNAMIKTLKTMAISIPVIALTKNDKHQGDHIFSSLDTQVRYLKDMPRQLRDLVLHIDSEAHRFAISHYRRRHRRAIAE